jgi:hypothetical protein
MNLVKGLHEYGQGGFSRKGEPDLARAQQQTAASMEQLGATVRQNANNDSVKRGSSLVDQAGATLQELVSAIRRVTDIMGEIGSASSEQRAECGHGRDREPAAAGRAAGAGGGGVPAGLAVPRRSRSIWLSQRQSNWPLRFLEPYE